MFRLFLTCSGFGFLSMPLLADEIGTAEIELCASTDVQMQCQTTCAPACNVADFLGSNTTYCLDNALIGAASSPTPDDASCSALFAVFSDEDPVEEVVIAESELTDDECAGLGTRSAQRRCELAKIAPACSPTVVELEGRARLLVSEIGIELDQYGDLLESDWTDVNNRDLLCGFSLEQLDQNYEVATENPEMLRALQRQANDLQSCQTNWEVWMRENAGTRSSDTLIDQVMRDAETQLGPLKDRITGLGQSVLKLESASGTIGEIIDVHIFLCDPEGTPEEIEN
jgi:hypothetical protein